MRRDRFTDGLVVVCVGMLYIMIMAGAALGLGYLIKEDKPKPTYYRSFGREDPTEESSTGPVEWSADRADNGPYMHFGSREEAEGFACTAYGAGWVYSTGTGWAQVDCLDASRMNHPSLPAERYDW